MGAELGRGKARSEEVVFLREFFGFIAVRLLSCGFQVLLCGNVLFCFQSGVLGKSSDPLSSVSEILPPLEVGRILPTEYWGSSNINKCQVGLGEHYQIRARAFTFISSRCFALDLSSIVNTNTESSEGLNYK